MAFTSVTPKRHWFLQLRKDRRQSTYHVYDSLTYTVVTRGLLTLDAGKAELRRLKHLPMYREVVAESRPPVPWSRPSAPQYEKTVN